MAGRVRVLPEEVEFPVAEGETVFAAAVRNGVRWPSICNGDCECGVCYMQVRAGHECLSAMSPQESQRLALGIKANDPTARLACRVRVSGEVTVFRRGVRWTS